MASDRVSVASPEEGRKYQSLRKSVLGFASPTPEGLSLNSRGCARHERTPGKGTRKVCHPGGVAPSPEPWTT